MRRQLQNRNQALVPVTVETGPLPPPFQFNCSQWEDFSSATSREWIISNGIGGYASSTLIGANTRRYHGLLVAALPPPLGRQVLLSKIEEEIGFDETFYSLSTNQYRDSVFPTGYRFLSNFSLRPFPNWIYQADGITLKKWIFLKQGENVAVAGYQLVHSARPVKLYLRLLVTYRNYHHLLRSDSKKFEQDESTGVVRVRTGSNGPVLYLSAPGAIYHKNGQWYYNFQFPREKERGLDFEEDLYCPGSFAVTLSPGESIYLIASTHAPVELNPAKWEKDEEQRLSSIASNVPVPDAALSHLFLAADTFLVKRNNLSVIAGYPWLNDWGRDTLISIPGLFLVPRKIEEAKRILEAFGPTLKNGLLPNSTYELEVEELKEISRQVRQGLERTPNQDAQLAFAYNSVDAPLWLFYAVYKTYLYSKDLGFVKRMLPFLESILEAYSKGTDFSIGLSSDGLLSSGTPETQLTWMDAKVGHLVVTPRNGAAVEVNALWYNALKIMEVLSPDKYGASRAESFRRIFEAKFWNSKTESLYDCVTSNGFDEAIRPNQIFALSLPFRLLPKEKEKKVLECVTTHLLTPFGLRTLNPGDPNYKGIYQGDRWLRDRALHQGSVWPWLLGPYLTALVNVEGEAARPRVFDLLSPILSHLQDAGVGTISEIFWGDFPHEPAGCIAKAWSVAEVLRAYVEEGLGITPGT